MKSKISSRTLLVLGLAASLFIRSLCLSAPAAVGRADKAFTDTFDVDKGELSSAGTNRYFVLLPGYSQTLEGTRVAAKRPCSRLRS